MCTNDKPQQAQGEQSDYDAAMDRIGDSVQGLAHALGMQDVDGDESAETILCRWLEHVAEVAKASNLKFDGDRIVPADQSGSAQAVAWMNDETGEIVPHFSQSYPAPWFALGRISALPAVDQSGSAPVADSATTGPAVDQADGKVSVPRDAAVFALQCMEGRIQFESPESAISVFQAAIAKGMSAEGA